MTFELTEAHISLIRRLRIEPTLQSPYADISIEINSKRPFGNSHIKGDILDIAHLGLPTKENLDKANRILSELPIAYRIVMQYGFNAGTYELTNDLHNLHTQCLSTYILLPALTESVKHLEKCMEDETDRIRKQKISDFIDNLYSMCEKPISKTPISDTIHMLKFFEPSKHPYVSDIIKIFKKYQERELITCQD